MPISTPASCKVTTPPLPPATRERIVQVADELFYQRGFEKTSFADIADQVGVSRGNFYHHFKSKDDILAAVIALRSARTQAMLDAWSRQATSPVGRLSCFADMLLRNRGDIQRFGCPVGTLNAELGKRAHPRIADDFNGRCGGCRSGPFAERPVYWPSVEISSGSGRARCPIRCTG